jgi:hypothetical protein
MVAIPTRKRNPSSNVKMVTRDVRITPSENGGFSVECSKKPEDKNDGDLAYQPPKTFVFESFDSMVDYLRDEFGAEGDSAADSVYDDKDE